MSGISCYIIIVTVSSFKAILSKSTESAWRADSESGQGAGSHRRLGFVDEQFHAATSDAAALVAFPDLPPPTRGLAAMDAGSHLSPTVYHVLGT
jgi:hypothetical protein